MKNLLKALAKAKQEIQPIVKGSTNPYFKKNYFDINAILLHIEPILHKNGLILTQPIDCDKISSKVYHVESGEVIESSMTLPGLQDPQKMGSAVTYYRRYTLQSLLALQADDDDGNLASKPVPVKAPYKKELTATIAKAEASRKLPLATMMKMYEMTADQQSKYIKLLG